jgi:radical SAM protein with 4Fe4S-binding SPASM domain
VTGEAQEDLYAKIVKKTWDQHIPLKVLWELTYRCNERCVHCYIVPDPTREELSTEEAIRIIDELAEEGCLFLTFSGGEALTRSDFFDIAGYARERGFAIRLLTNGTLITPEVADRIKALRPVTVEISIYGITPSIHDAVTRVPGSHEKSVRALTLLHERRMRVVVKSPLMHNTVDEFEGLKQLAEGLDGGFVYDVSLMPRDDGSCEPLAYVLTDEDLRRFYERRPPKGDFTKLQPADHVCNSGLNIAAISPYGDVYPCVGLKLKAGNLREQSFQSIWRESAILAALRFCTFSNVSGCQDCELASYCNRCPGVAYLESGDYLSPSAIACREAKIRKAVLDMKGITAKSEASLAQTCDKS